MMRAAALLIAALAGPAVAGPAQQPGRAALVPDWGREKVRGQPLEVAYFNGFADCVVTYWPKHAEAVVQTSHGPAAKWSPATREMAQDAALCVASGAVRMDEHRLVGAFAEALLRKGRVAAGATPRFGNDETWATYSAKLGSVPQEERWQVAARWAAYCTVRSDPAGVEALLRTRPRTKPEVAALKALDARFLACLPKGHRLSGGAASMRGFLAEALYWRRVSEGGPGA